MSASSAITPAAPASLTQLAVPVMNQSSVPAAVREGSSAAKQAYTTGQGFEEMLLQQLSQSLAQSSGLGGEGDGGEGGGEEEGASSQAGGALEALLPQALTEGIMRGGGIGLATQLMHTLDPAASHASSAVVPTGAENAGVGSRGPQELSPSGGVPATATPTPTARTGGTSA